MRFLRLAGLILAFVWIGLPAQAGEQVSLIASHIQINADRSLDVTEQIHVIAEGRQIKRGLYRNIPIRFTFPDGERISVPIEVLSVRRDGVNEPYTTSRSGTDLQIRIGDANVFLTPGPYSYEIRYRVRRALVEEDGKAVLRWYASGWDWNLVRQSVAVSVGFADAELTPLEAFEGTPGDIHALPLETAGLHSVRANSTRPLGNGEDVGIAVSVPLSALAPVGQTEELGNFARDHAYAFAWMAILLITTTVLFVLWMWIGRDPVRKSVIPRFRAPEGLSPAAVRMIWQRKYDSGVMTAAFASLIAKNRIEVDHVDGSFLQGDSLTVRDTGNKSADLASGETIVFADMLADRDFYVLPNSSSEKSAQTKFNSMRSAFQSHMESSFSDRYFSHNRGPFLFVMIASLAAGVAGYIWATTVGSPEPTVTDAPLGLIMIPVIALPFYLLARVLDIIVAYRKRGVPFRIKNNLDLLGLFVFSAFLTGGDPLWPWTGVWGVVPWVITAHMAMLVLFRLLIEAPTPEGARAMEKILGLRLYLSVAEEGRLNAMGAPEQTPEHMRETYAYAVALDVEDEWSKKLDRLIDTIPFRDAHDPALGSIHRARLGGYVLGRSLSSSVASATSASMPKSSSSGGFSSGGGFSGGGGGFGGGGGGGW